MLFRSATDGVRYYAAQLGRWVKTHSPLKLLNTPINRAIVAGNHECYSEDNAPSRASATSELQAKVVKLRKVYILKTENGDVRRAGGQVAIDTALRPLLKICLPHDGAPTSTE